MIKTIIIIAVVSILGFGAYKFLFPAPNPDLLTSTGVTTDSAVGQLAVGQKLISIGDSLNKLDFKKFDAFFSNNVFNSLQKSEYVLYPESDIGRDNPFAPTAGAAASSTSTSTSSSTSTTTGSTTTTTTTTQ